MESEKMSQFKDRIFHADCLEGMREMPDGCVDLVVADPPYNIGKADWDKIPDYIEWSRKWIQECERLLKPTGVFYFWHNDMPQLAGIMEMIRKSTHFRFKSFCILEKKNFRTFISVRIPDAGGVGIRIQAVGVQRGDLGTRSRACACIEIYTQHRRGALQRLGYACGFIQTAPYMPEAPARYRADYPRIFKPRRSGSGSVHGKRDNSGGVCARRAALCRV